MLEMYAKNDYVGHFMKTDLDNVTNKQFLDLF
jgi:hypothetical protein